MGLSDGRTHVKPLGVPGRVSLDALAAILGNHLHLEGLYEVHVLHSAAMDVGDAHADSLRFVYLHSKPVLSDSVCYMSVHQLPFQPSEDD